MQHEDGRRSIFYGKPAADLPPTAAVPRDWDEGDYLEKLRLEREERRRLQRAARAGNPPPRRGDAKYGPQAGNPRGDDAFRDGRRAWYELVMEVSLEGIELSEQWRLCDALARRFRTYSDGRRGHPSVESPDNE